MHLCQTQNVVNDLTAFIIILLVAWLIILGLYTRFKIPNVIVYPLLIIVRSNLFQRVIEKVGQRGRKFFIILSDVFLVISSTMMIIFPLLLIVNELFGSSEFISLNALKVYNIDTLLIILFSLFLSLVIHEFFHAILLVANDGKIISAGAILLAFLLLFFVETEESKFQKLPKIKKLRVISAGSAANFLSVGLFLPLLIFLPTLISPLYTPSDGAIVLNVQSGTPASEAGIQKGDLISHIYLLDSYNVIQEGFRIVKARDLSNLIRSLNPGTNLLLNVSGQLLSLQTKEIGGVTQIGVTLGDYYQRSLQFAPILLPYYVQSLLSWIINFSITLGFINLLTFPHSDGDQLLKELLNGTKYTGVLKLFRFIVTPLSVLLLLKSIFV